MIDLYIFGFGLAVFVLVGSGLAAMILANNREVDAVEAAAEVEQVRSRQRP